MLESKKNIPNEERLLRHSFLGAENVSAGGGGGGGGGSLQGCTTVYVNVCM